jgi:hypothetical protein
MKGKQPSNPRDNRNPGGTGGPPQAPPSSSNYPLTPAVTASRSYSSSAGGSNAGSNDYASVSLNDSASVTSDSIYSQASVSSSYRHHNAGPFMPQTPATPKPVLTQDAQHQPKTRGSLGLLIVGLGGANGATLLAGCIANRLQISWHGPVGEPMTPNYYGCITQIDQRGKYGGVGYRDKVRGLADVSMAAIGGWVRYRCR